MYVNVTRFTKTGHNSASFYCTIMFWHLKLPFVHRNIKSVLQSDSLLQVVKARDAIHGLICIHSYGNSNYTYLNIRP